MIFSILVAANTWAAEYFDTTCESRDPAACTPFNPTNTFIDNTAVGVAQKMSPPRETMSK